MCMCVYKVSWSKETAENTSSFLFPLGLAREIVYVVVVGKPSIFPLGVILTPFRYCRVLYIYIHYAVLIRGGRKE